MYTRIFILALLLAILGIAGSVLPVIPGIIFSLFAMLSIEVFTPVSFSSSIRIVFTILIALAVLSDYVFPILGARYGGGTKAGIRGSLLGMIAGLFFMPVGLIVGPLLGAFVGELRAKKNTAHAVRAAWGSFLGSVGSMVIKLIASGVVLFWVIQAWM